MMGKNQHVVPSKTGKGWDVKPAGGTATSHHRTQANAAEKAVANAKQAKSEVLIHRPNGQIRSKDSYGNDPNPPKDKEN
ncbi:MAG: DUF2188 domain-containing protein [Proteobacteria bacterium]|nr:MAG: DUF2188 domain-containing protein [Pseudomonadota bacterium]